MAPQTISSMVNVDDIRHLVYVYDRDPETRAIGPPREVSRVLGTPGHRLNGPGARARGLLGGL